MLNITSGSQPYLIAKIVGEGPISFLVQKSASKVLKTGYFANFLSQWGARAPLPPGCATESAQQYLDCAFFPNSGKDYNKTKKGLRSKLQRFFYQTSGEYPRSRRNVVLILFPNYLGEQRQIQIRIHFFEKTGSGSAKKRGYRVRFVPDPLPPLIQTKQIKCKQWTIGRNFICCRHKHTNCLILTNFIYCRLINLYRPVSRAVIHSAL